MSVTGGGRGCDTPILGDGRGSYFKLLSVDLVGLQRETMEIKYYDEIISTYESN